MDFRSPGGDKRLGSPQTRDRHQQSEPEIQEQNTPSNSQQPAEAGAPAQQNVAESQAPDTANTPVTKEIEKLRKSKLKAEIEAWKYAQRANISVDKAKSDLASLGVDNFLINTKGVNKLRKERKNDIKEKHKIAQKESFELDAGDRAKEKGMDKNIYKLMLVQNGCDPDNFLFRPWESSQRVRDLYDNTPAGYERRKERLQGKGSVPGPTKQKGPSCRIHSETGSPLVAAGLDTGPLKALTERLAVTQEKKREIKKAGGLLRYAEDNPGKSRARNYLANTIRNTRSPIETDFDNYGALAATGLAIERLYEEMESQAIEESVADLGRLKENNPSNARERAGELLNKYSTYKQNIQQEISERTRPIATELQELKNMRNDANSALTYSPKAMEMRKTMLRISNPNMTEDEINQHCLVKNCIKDIENAINNINIYQSTFGAKEQEYNRQVESATNEAASNMPQEIRDIEQHITKRITDREHTSKELRAGETLFKYLNYSNHPIYDGSFYSDKSSFMPNENIEQLEHWLINTLNDFGGTAMLGTTQSPLNLDKTSYDTGEAMEDGGHAIYINGIIERNGELCVGLRDPNLNDNEILEIPIRKFLQVYNPHINRRKSTTALANRLGGILPYTRLQNIKLNDELVDALTNQPEQTQSGSQ